MPWGHVESRLFDTLEWATENDWDSAVSETNVSHPGDELTLFVPGFEDQFDDGQLDGEWQIQTAADTTVSEQNGEIQIDKSGTAAEYGGVGRAMNAENDLFWEFDWTQASIEGRTSLAFYLPNGPDTSQSQATDGVPDNCYYLDFQSEGGGSYGYVKLMKKVGGNTTKIQGGLFGGFGDADYRGTWRVEMDSNQSVQVFHDGTAAPDGPWSLTEWSSTGGVQLVANPANGERHTVNYFRSGDLGTVESGTLTTATKSFGDSETPNLANLDYDLNGGGIDLTVIGSPSGTAESHTVTLDGSASYSLSWSSSHSNFRTGCSLSHGSAAPRINRIELKTD
jgi:hypothetical protein